MATDDPPIMTTQTGLSLAVVALLLGAAVVYGRQSQRLDVIETTVNEIRAELRESHAEVRSLRELLIQRTPLSPGR